MAKPSTSSGKTNSVMESTASPPLMVCRLFSFTKNTTAAKIGPLELKVQEKESVNIPQWLSLGALALGGLVLVIGFRKP